MALRGRDAPPAGQVFPSQLGQVLPLMALRGRDAPPATVAVLVVIAVHPRLPPGSRRVEVGKAVRRPGGAVLAGAERLRVGVIVTGARAAIGGGDAQPIERFQHGLPLHGTAVIGRQHSRLIHAALRQHGAAHPRRGVPRRRAGVDFPAADRAAVAIDPRVEVEAQPLHRSGPPRDIPRPHGLRRSGDSPGRRGRGPERAATPSMPVRVRRAQHAVDARCRGQGRALIGPPGDDRPRWQAGIGGLMAAHPHRRPFPGTERVRRRRPPAGPRLGGRGPASSAGRGAHPGPVPRTAAQAAPPLDALPRSAQRRGGDPQRGSYGLALPPDRRGFFSQDPQRRRFCQRLVLALALAFQFPTAALVQVGLGVQPRGADAEPAWACSQARRQAWTGAGDTPRLRQYSPRGTSFREAVSTPLAHFSSAPHRAAELAVGRGVHPRRRRAWPRQPYNVACGIPVSRASADTPACWGGSIRSISFACRSSG